MGALSKDIGLGLTVRQISIGTPVKIPNLGLTMRQISLGLVGLIRCLNVRVLDGAIPVETDYYIWKFEDGTLMQFEDSTYIMWTE